ncbi:hypothetical protein TRVA0_067S00496 [Trichomonascus vanleenenianus]|uniref:uncharacterized protein n=1 Tax=Trichomonascus vanleenenianus TaxID=2268995 RepID=UPI003ECA7D29
MSKNDNVSQAQYADYPFEEMGLRSHIPPTLKDIEIELAKDVTGKTDSGKTSGSALETVIKSPPLPGEVGHKFITMKLTKEFKSPKKDRQHLFLAIVTSSQKTSELPAIRDYEGKTHRFEVVVEIFDPLCFEGANPAALADSAYARTVMAYDALKDRQKQIVPKYHGSYTMRIPVIHSRCKFREVRIILR